MQHVAEGNTDVDAIAKAIEAAKAVTNKPSIIKVTTTIGYGSPNKADTAGVHGAALGEEEAALTRQQLGWDYAPFEIPQDAYDQFRQAIDRGASLEAEWNQTLASYRTKYPPKPPNSSACCAASCPRAGTRTCPPTPPKTVAWPPIAPDLPGCSRPEPARTDRRLSRPHPLQLHRHQGRDRLYQAGSLKRYLHFGVREHAMAAILNGIAYHNSGLIPYGGTFLVFADYMRGSMRLSALSELGVIYVLTHDSIGVGEDGPTHQPIETIPSLQGDAEHAGVPSWRRQRDQRCTRWPSKTASAPAPSASAARAWPTRPTPRSTRWPWVVTY